MGIESESSKPSKAEKLASYNESNQSATVSAATESSSLPKEQPIKGYVGIDLSTGHFEFGGPWGALALMIWSHYIVFYFW